MKTNVIKAKCFLPYIHTEFRYRFAYMHIIYGDLKQITKQKIKIKSLQC